MRKVAVFTGTRAEYGLLFGLMKEIRAESELELQVIVSGMHLSPEFGETWKIIEKDGIKIDAKVEMLLSSDTTVGIAKSMGLGTIGFADSLSRLQPDILVVLGDRFEALAITQVAMIMHIPIVHLHGGEITEGAYDDAIRHAITKMSTYHCTATEVYRKRVIQLGEQPEKVVNVGAIGLDYLKASDFLSLGQLSESLNFNLNKPFFLVTYHPVTLAKEVPVATLQAIFDALDTYTEYQIIITYPNADHGGRQLITMINAYAEQRQERVLAIASLGQMRYLSALKHAEACIGNSSSGIIEAPSLGVPTVNVGERQKGRLSANSVLHCGTSYEKIKTAIASAISENERKKRGPINNPYGEGDATEKITNLLKKMDLNCLKTFYDHDMSLESIQ